MYSELYSLRHFCVFRDDASAAIPQREYDGAVRGFLASGREEEIARLYDDLVRVSVPIERVIVVRKQLVHDDESPYRMRYAASHAYPESAKDSP